MADPYPPREDKSTSFTLTVTLLLMGALLIVAWVLKRNAADHSPPPPPNNQLSAASAAHSPGAAQPSIPLDANGQPKSEYEIMTRCTLEDDPANDGDTFRLATPHGSHLFRLYWVQTVQMNGDSPEATREAMDHFGIKTEDHLRELAVEARDFTLNTLKSVPFQIVTGWVKDPADGAFRCFAYASDAASATLQNLSLLLVQNGLAMIRPSLNAPPDPATTAGDFQNQLTHAESEAKRTLSGGWAKKGG